jgi:hypothetical protein
MKKPVKKGRPRKSANAKGAGRRVGKSAKKVSTKTASELKAAQRLTAVPLEDRPQTAYELYREALEAPPANFTPGQGVSVKTPEICGVFLLWLSKGYMPGVAAEKIGIARSTAFKWKREDPQFAEAWEEAIEVGNDLLEQELRRRAVEGYDRPVFQKGFCVGFERVYSDNVAMMLLQGRRRSVYGKVQDGGDKETTVTIKGGLPEGSTVTVHKGGRVETAEVEPDMEKPGNELDNQ